MFPNDLSTIALVLLCISIVVLAICLYYCVRAVRYSQAAWRFVSEQNENSVSLKAIAGIETQLTDLYDAHHALFDSHKKLRSRIGMRELRQKRRNADEPDETLDEIPDPKKDPEGWKRAMRARLRLNKT